MTTPRRLTRTNFGTSRRRGRAMLIGLGALLASGAIATGQEFLRFDETPYVSALEPERFAAIFAAARTTTIKAALIGDSQETSPGGFGYIYVPRLNYEFYRIYGNAPATPLSSAWVNTGGGQPAADWLIRSQAPSPGFGPSRLLPRQILPNIQGGASSTLGGNNINDNQLYGGNILLEPDAIDTAAAAALRGGVYFDTGGGVFIDVFAATNPSSGEVRCGIASAPTHEPSAFLPPLLSVDTSMGLMDPVLGFRSQRLGPFAVAADGYLQATLSGTDPNALTDILAITFTSAARPEGWVVSSVSAGGYKVSDYLANHGESTPLLAQYRPDVVFLHFGANDAGTGRTPAEFKADVETLIAHLRAVVGSDLPVIVFSDPYNRSLNPEKAANFDRFAGVAYAIAQADPLTSAVNSRRLADEIGWNETRSGPFLVDGIHYTPDGAKALAELEVSAMASAFGQPCAGPDIAIQPSPVITCEHASTAIFTQSSTSLLVTYQWERVDAAGLGTALTDGAFAPGSAAIVQGARAQFLTLQQVDQVVGAYRYRCVISNGCASTNTQAVEIRVLTQDTPECVPVACDADVNQDGNVDQGDVDYLINAVAGGDNPNDIDVDFNRDGNADQSDIDAIIDVIAGGNCP